MPVDTTKTPRRKPLTRKLSGRAVMHAIDGRERPFPTYHFSRRQFFEKPNHNPFKGL